MTRILVLWFTCSVFYYWNLFFLSSVTEFFNSVIFSPMASVSKCGTFHVLFFFWCHIDVSLCLSKVHESGISVRVSTAVAEHHDQQHLGKERVYFILMHSPSFREVRTGTQGRSLGGSGWCRAVKECYLQVCSWRLAHPCFSIAPRTTCPGMVPPTSITKKMHHCLAYRSSWWWHFFS